MRNIPREIADKYQGFFEFLNQEHDLILTIDEMDEIIFEAQKLVENFSIAPVIDTLPKTPFVKCDNCGTEYNTKFMSECYCVG